MNWLIFYLCIWFGLGVVGYFLMRQGFLVDYENVLGKDEAWGWAEVVLGILLVVAGPLAIFIALALKGNSCFKKRPSHD